ncbi:nucleotide-binding protein [Candidatus Bathyarchaeota archaeon]|nr:nucleotide-binding protein [Candidatus Bathyarchaeota archaeon]
MKLVKVILDSNFLLVPFQFKIDIFSELERLLGKAEPVVLSTTITELEGLARSGSSKVAKQALAALELAKKCAEWYVETFLNESCDDVVLRFAELEGCVVATNDAVLRRRLRKAKVPAVYVRQRSHLEIDGQVPR